jgi:hypothetical protein
MSDGETVISFDDAVDGIISSCKVNILLMTSLTKLGYVLGHRLVR